MTLTAHRIRTTTAVAALLAAVALAGPPTVSAATTPTINGTTLTLTGDDAADRVVVGEDAGLLTVTVNGAPLNLGAALPADNTIDLVANAGGGDDEITITTANLKSVTADGGAGDDILTGNNDNDTLSGGDGDDRVIGARGADTMAGGAGNDVLVWNNGDGNDRMDGDGNADEVEVNGAPTQGDTFTVQPNAAEAGRVRFDRTNLGLFNLNISAERITINALGGDDVVSASSGLGALIAMTANGGPGADSLTGADGADLLNGGDDNDTLSGGAGNDRLVGDRGADTMNGRDGEDTTVWNNGDGSDVMNGEAGLDRVEVNGANTAETFTLAPNGARAKFDRTSAGAFSLDIGSAESLDLRALAGDDTFTASPGTGALLAVLADAGAGNDTLTGAEETDTFLAGSGNDAVTGGAGPDVLDGQDGDDSLLARDTQGDLVRGGNGTDSAQTDALGVDVVNTVESVDATPAPVVTPPPAADTTATAAIVRSTRPTVTIRRGRASVRLSIECPAAEAGGCAGTLTLVSAKPIKIGSHKVIALLGSARYSLKAGERKTVTVALPKGVRKLAVKRAIAARAQTISTDAAGNVAVASRAVTLKFAR
ncbi:MAG TPA: calcium-binding protein [Solirubrobacteraceae bacterium]|nr:calcium-binding protein [Solirubrobacteraceae bacterium]